MKVEAIALFTAVRLLLIGFLTNQDNITLLLIAGAVLDLWLFWLEKRGSCE